MSRADTEKIVKIYESKILIEMDAGDVLGGGDFPDTLENQDNYAPGDNRIPYLIGVQTRNGMVKRRKKKAKRSRRS